VCFLFLVLRVFFVERVSRREVVEVSRSLGWD
jgi:hypothetical protein